MWKPIYQPEPWPQFRKRKDIVFLPLMEQRKKYMQEQLLFENYLSTLNTLNTVSTAAAGATGGPAPSTGGGADDWDIILKIDTRIQAAPEYWWTGSAFTQTQETVHVNLTSYNKINIRTQITYDLPSPVTIDWGDGIVEENITRYNTWTEGFGGIQNGLIGSAFNAGGTDYFYPHATQAHTYSTEGEYIIKVKGEGAYDMTLSWLPLVEIIRFNPILAQNTYGLFFNSQANDYIEEQISTWDTSQWVDLDSMFFNYNQPNPGSGEGTSTYREQAYFTSSFNPNVENWDLSNIDTTISDESSEIFKGLKHFSRDLRNWDVRGFEYPRGIFEGCENLVSGARADLWDFSNTDLYDGTSFSYIFQSSMTSPEARGTMPHVGNWDLSSINDGTNNVFSFAFSGSGFSHTAIGETLIGWASQSLLPNNIGMGTNSFASTWDGSGFSDPVFSTGSAFGLEVSASYDYLVTTKGWTISNISFT